jgi:hypothetical protein
MTQEELQKLIAQQYGNVITAGSALTANAASYSNCKCSRY